MTVRGRVRKAQGTMHSGTKCVEFMGLGSRFSGRGPGTEGFKRSSAG